jgi:PST family polysaccharide transporter
MANREGHGIGTRALRGVFWAYGSYAGGRLLSLLATAILARLLVPDQFGLVALALVFISLLETVADLGLGQALVVAKDDFEDRADTVFRFTVLIGLVLTLLAAGASPLAARFFDEPELTKLLPILGLTFMLRSLGSTHYAIAQRDLDFRTRTGAEVAEVAVRGLVGVALAIAGFGAYSLVFGYLAGTLTLDIVLWALVRWRPRLTRRRTHLREMVRFGGTLSAVNVIAALIANVDDLFVGRVLGTTALGFYTLAFRLPELLILNLSVVASRVLFPAFAAVDRAALGQAFLMSLRYTLMVGLPLALGLAVMAEPVVMAVFGDQWGGSVGPMRVLALYALSLTVGIPGGTAYKATGRADVLLKLAIPRLLALVVALLIFGDDGIAAVAACQAVTALTFDLAGLALASRLLDVGIPAMWQAVRPVVLAGAATAVALGGVALAVEAVWLTLVLGALLGGCCYLGLLFVLAGDSLRGLRDMALPGRPAGGEAASPMAGSGPAGS